MLGERLGHRPALDGLRGLAVLMVMACHLWSRFPARGGFLGVDVFFVLSGFLITRLLIEEIRRSGRIELRSFYRRRAARLLPAVGVLIAVVVVIAVATSWWGDIRSRMLLGSLTTLTHTSNWARIAGDSLGRLGHTWSLAVEEQFYIVWPIVLALIVRRTQRVSSVVAALLAVVVAESTGRAWFSENSALFYHASDSHGAVALLGGSLLALWMSEGRAGVASLRRLAWPAAVVLAAAATVLPSSTIWLYRGPLVVVT